jgi:hypothetical protein
VFWGMGLDILRFELRAERLLEGSYHLSHSISPVFLMIQVSH